jgi:hypothetical protein
MKDPADCYTPDLFGPNPLPQHIHRRTTCLRRYHNPDDNRLDMFITRRSFARLDALAHAQACTKQAMVETLLDKAWETAEGTMTQVVLWGD